MNKETEELKKQIAELKDFCIWLIGCGYDFTQHEYFCKKRDELLKGDGSKESLSVFEFLNNKDDGIYHFFLKDGYFKKEYCDCGKELILTMYTPYDDFYYECPNGNKMNLDRNDFLE